MSCKKPEIVGCLRPLGIAAQGVHDFLDRLPTRLLVRRLGIEPRELPAITDLVDQVADDLDQRVLMATAAIAGDQVAKLRYGLQARLAEDVPQRPALPGGLFQQGLHGALADAAGRIVDDPQGRDLVAGVGERFQVGQQVADLLAIVERHAADQHVGDLGPPQLQLERPRLLVRAAEDGEVAVASA